MNTASARVFGLAILWGVAGSGACTGACTGADGAPGALTTDGGAPTPEDAHADGQREASSDPDTGTTPLPKRLRLNDDRVLDPDGRPVVLRGANLQGATPAEAADLADNLKMNLARLRISFQAPNLDERDPSGFTAAYRAEIDGWVSALANKKVWVVLELRGDDTFTNTPGLYQTGAKEFNAYKGAWVYLARRFKSQDYIAGYGLLAEPSVNKTGLLDGVAVLTKFQSALMDAITNEAGDTTTPFFVGPDFNYDAMQYRDDRYYTALAPHRGRLFYAVNFLMPKPWIQDGLGPDGSRPTWPIEPAPTSYGSLHEVKPGERYSFPEDMEVIFNKRREEPEGFAKTMSAGFTDWYFTYAKAFRAKHRVPMYVDQFGASTESKGQLVYEKTLLRQFEKEGLHWCRWSYNAGTPSRMLKGNASVMDLYRGLAADRDGGT
jgi:hypothetical protein